MKRRWGLAIGAIIAGGFLVLWLATRKPGIPPNFSTPEPCIVNNVFLNAVPDTICHDKGVGNCQVALSRPRTMNAAIGQLACCPVGFDPQFLEDGVTVFCKKIQ